MRHIIMGTSSFGLAMHHPLPGGCGRLGFDPSSDSILKDLSSTHRIRSLDSSWISRWTKDFLSSIDRRGNRWPRSREEWLEPTWSHTHSVCRNATHRIKRRVQHVLRAKKPSEEKHHEIRGNEPNGKDGVHACPCSECTGRHRTTAAPCRTW